MLMRPTPFDLVFEPLADGRFPAIQAALAADRRDPRDRDGFLMAKEASELVRELRPDDGVGEGMDQLVALVHHAFLLWLAGVPVLPVTREQLGHLLDGPGPGEPAGETPAAWYAQLPERRIWAQVLEGAAHEPLDGCFAHQEADGALRVLGVFGMHPERAGFTVVEARGERPGLQRRPDGSAPFTPLLPGAEAAGLHSLAGTDELLELAWRIRNLGRALAAAAAEH
jgi:hypothetical protein